MKATIVFVIRMKSKKIINIMVLMEKCKICDNDPNREHKCFAINEGSSKGMEVNSICKMHIAAFNHETFDIKRLHVIIMQNQERIHNIHFKI